ncbi:Gamma-2-syntrophin [Labeo rohita]|uniref:Gamma-2-syntrophin n=1 Tax=Labeo rohita TaxID=84645 RepID=A0ABQ8LUW9_LABRO|nr:Gamma-2-syntrophin [Labeo rohita]
MATAPYLSCSWEYKASEIRSDLNMNVSKSYMCSSQGKILCFTLDFESGFSCSDSVSKMPVVVASHPQRPLPQQLIDMSVLPQTRPKSAVTVRPPLFRCWSRDKTIWKYKFSQLKGSSDDGKTRVKLLFQNSENKQIEMKELEFANLTAVLHCIHSFIAAKVATVDPVFVNNQSLTQKYMCSS